MNWQPLLSHMVEYVLGLEHDLIARSSSVSSNQLITNSYVAAQLL